MPREQEYLSFLQATLASLSENVHAGYFGEDRGSGDEAVQAEVDDILKNKEKLLSFKDDKGKWQTRRFLFSKWTLREGWDNPNVFVIAKLRTSGSENSKIQEVGRGLRLPVDENGHRLQQTELPSRLRFLIGYDEKAFAESLVTEVNDDTTIKLDETKITDNMIEIILKDDASLTKDQLLEELDTEGIINRSNEFRENGLNKLLDLYPVLGQQSRVRQDKITVGGPKFKQRIKLNKDNWNQMRELWEQFSNRYMLEFTRIDEDALQFLIDDVMHEEDIFVKQYAESVHQTLAYSEKNSEMQINEQTAEYEKLNALNGMKYGEFLKILVKETNLKPAQLHRGLYAVLKDKLNSNTDYLNEKTLNNLKRAFTQHFEKSYAQSYQYSALDFQASTSVFDAKSNDFKEDVLASVIGVNEDDNVADNRRQLYELPPLRYDSVNPERELLRRDYDANVISFGKLPKKAIQIPKYTGGSTTPDFVYIVEKPDNTKVYLLVETKAEGSGKRISDTQIMAIQKEFFGQLKENGVAYKVATTAEDVFTKLRGISK